MSTPVTNHETRATLIEYQRAFYDSAKSEGRLQQILRDGPYSKLSAWDIHRLLRTSRSVYFDTHIQLLSGHHTQTYLRFESVARFPQLLTLIGRDMADWIRKTFQTTPIAGLVTTASHAALLAERVADLLRDTLRLRVILTPYDRETGRVGTEVGTGVIRAGEAYVLLNDQTIRGQGLSTLFDVVTRYGGTPAGMMVFARRDSGQFPAINDITGRTPFFFTTDVEMPQWEPSACPQCAANRPLLLWKDVPEF